MKNNDGSFHGSADVDSRTLKYMSLYFDLCSEEYHLWRTGVVPQYIWTLWKDGMRITMRKEIYRHSWAALKQNYYTEFSSFFEHEVIGISNQPH